MFIKSYFFLTGILSSKQIKVYKSNPLINSLRIPIDLYNVSNLVIILFFDKKLIEF